MSKLRANRKEYSHKALGGATNRLNHAVMTVTQRKNTVDPSRATVVWHNLKVFRLALHILDLVQLIAYRVLSKIVYQPSLDLKGFLSPSLLLKNVRWLMSVLSHRKYSILLKFKCLFVFWPLTFMDFAAFVKMYQFTVFQWWTMGKCEREVHCLNDIRQSWLNMPLNSH